MYLQSLKLLHVHPTAWEKIQFNKKHDRWTDICPDRRTLSQLWYKMDTPFFSKEKNGFANAATDVILQQQLTPASARFPSAFKTVTISFDILRFLALALQARCRERSGLVVECLTRDRGAAGSSLTGVTPLWFLNKTHLS